MKCNTCGKMNCLAHGGSVDEGPSEKANQSGVHKIVPNFDREHSEVKHGQSEARYGDKKAKHGEVLKELRAMPKPKLKGLAHGGKVETRRGESEMGSIVRGDHAKRMATGRGEGPSEASEQAKGMTMERMRRAPNPNLKGLAKGGMPEDAPDMPDHDDSGIDDELNDMVADECFEAFEKKDKKAFVEAMKALIMNVGGN